MRYYNVGLAVTVLVVIEKLNLNHSTGMLGPLGKFSSDSLSMGPTFVMICYEISTCSFRNEMILVHSIMSQSCFSIVSLNGEKVIRKFISQLLLHRFLFFSAIKESLL